MSTEILIGKDYWKHEREQIDQPVYWKSSEVSNHHVGVAGTTGAGKTHWIRTFVAGMPEDVEIDIFDYHGDIDIAGSKEVLFSEATRYGYNPLVLNPDPHYGGVRRAVADVIETINSTSHKLGGNQESVLRHLLIDAYAARGIVADDPQSWHRREADDGEIREIIARQDWSALRQVYPTLTDVIRLGKRKLKALWMGIDDGEPGKRSLSAFDEYCRTMQQLNRARSRHNAASSKMDTDEVERLEKKLVALRDKAKEAHSLFLEEMTTGMEFEEAIKYNSKDVMLSVITRLENLKSLGLFTPNPPPFGSDRIRRYNIKPLAQSEDELKMFVRFRLRSIIREMMQRGDSGGKLRRLIVLDESKMFNDEERTNPINRIVNEMRKFGLAILLAGQSPSHFSSDFIANAGTLLLLNLATSDWDEAARKLKIDQKKLRYLRPQMSGAVRMLEKGKTAEFRTVSFA